LKRRPRAQESIFSRADVAEAYATQHLKMAEGFGHEIAKRIVSRGIEEARVLDVGCGSGATNLTLAQHFPRFQLVGIDLSDPLIDLAGRSSQAQGFYDRVRFEKGNALQIPYENGSFNVVLNLNMVHLVKDPVRMLDEIERVLAPDGFLFIADLRRSWLGLLEKEIQSAVTLKL
jgi:ubiquinone/menaquinone biosynthesis C-methylase UbiE